MAAQLVFFVTGASSGLGLSICHSVLAAGHKVVATMRNPAKTPELVARLELNMNAKVVQLDVAADTLEQQIGECLQAFGVIDVLLNNAGYGYGSTLKDASLDEARHLFETLFWGPVRTTKALVRHMRERRSGFIVNITSTEGVSGTPGISFYGAAKHALEGFSEAIATELQPFGIRVLVVEPGSIRTEFFSPANVASLSTVSEAYRGTPVDQFLQMMPNVHGHEGLDPDRCAARIVEAVTGGGDDWPAESSKYLRLPLGKEMLGRGSAKLDILRENWSALDDIARSCDFE